ncbi:MAG: hypothetical protein ABSA49_02195 [Rhizomicrobium sp.]|jgi:hypothetical protein
MRFGFLVAAVVAGGALMGASAQILLDPSSAWTAQPRVVAAAPAVKFDIGDLNPLKLIYDEVMKQVATDANRPSFAVGTPVPVADFSKMDAQIKLNNEKFRRMSNPDDVGGLPE